MYQTLELPTGERVLFDDADAAMVYAHKWRRVGGKGKYYAATSIGGRNLKMHRLIMGLPESSIDHKNGDPFDNRRENLRPCTQNQNMWNRRKTAKPTSSRFKGVSRRKDDKKPWLATIRIRGLKVYLGCFEREEDAARAYDEAARLHFGEFAKPNEALTRQFADPQFWERGRKAREEFDK